MAENNLFQLAQVVTELPTHHHNNQPSSPMPHSHYNNHPLPARKVFCRKKN